MTPQHFFMAALPRVVGQNVRQFAAMRGRVSFEVRTASGGAGWTVQFGDVRRPILGRRSKDADLRLRFRGDALSQFIKGTLALEPALARGDVLFRGDITLLLQLHMLLSTKKGPLATRLNLSM